MDINVDVHMPIWAQIRPGANERHQNSSRVYFQAYDIYLFIYVICIHLFISYATVQRAHYSPAYRSSTRRFSLLWAKFKYQ